nr:M48 family metalloprotease [uncultured Flavobacterium sp.]
MLEYFLGGVLLYLSMFCFRFFFVFFLSKYYNESFTKNFEFDLIQFIIESIFFGAVFLSFMLISEILIQRNLLLSLVSVLIISLIPTYLFIISPIQFLLKKKEYSDFDSNFFCTNYSILKSYKIKVINKNVFNAYATGIIPFSKTILIGKPLVDNLTKEELFSILLHEAGHLKLNHLNKLYFINLIIAVVSHLLFQLRSFYFHYDNEILNVFFVGITGAMFGLLLWFLPGKIQYKFEFEADRFAAKYNGEENLINALKKLDEMSNGDVSKGGITHPKLIFRINNILKQ